MKLELPDSSVSHSLPGQSFHNFWASRSVLTSFPLGLFGDHGKSKKPTNKHCVF